MSMPDFNAEASLYTTSELYRSTIRDTHNDGYIFPAQRLFSEDELLALSRLFLKDELLFSQFIQPLIELESLI